jgi:hypothetical protein
MNTWQSTVGLFAGFFSILCFIPYIITTIRGKTKPSRVTWWIWFVLSMIVSFNQYTAGAIHTIWFSLGGGIAQLIIAIYSLKKGEGTWSPFDRMCLFSAIGSLLLWWIFNSPLIALVLNLVTDILGTLPTIKKTYFEPETENSLTWFSYFIASILNVLALENWSFTSSLFPLYILIVNSIIVVLLLRPRQVIHRTPQTSWEKLQVGLSIWCSGFWYSRFWLTLQMLHPSYNLQSSKLGGRPVKYRTHAKYQQPDFPLQTQCIRPVYFETH